VLVIAFTESLNVQVDEEQFYPLFDKLKVIKNLKLAFVELNHDVYDALVQVENTLIEYGCPGRLFYDERHALKWLK
jgi:hypothetical protein